MVRISSTLFAAPQSTIYPMLLSVRRFGKIFTLAAVVYALVRLLDYGLLLRIRKYSEYCLSRRSGVGFNDESALKSLLDTYQIHARSADEERRLGERPLRWIDIELTKRSSRALSASCHASSNNESVILVVHSRAENAEARQYFRQQLLLANVKNNYFRPIFVISTADFDADSALSLQIRSEIDRYGDMMELENVDESYRNMSHKVRAWVDHLSKCRSASTAKFVVKIDEDVNVDFSALRALLDTRFADRKRVVLCRTYLNGQITRNPHSKWYLSTAEFAAPSLGLYCQGMAYAFSVDLLPAMHANLRRVQFLWMDDWYATHALMNTTNAMYVDVGPHVISADGATEVAELLGAADEERAEKWQKRFARFPPIFGHFRPASSYSPQVSRELWRRIKSRFGDHCGTLAIFRR